MIARAYGWAAERLEERGRLAGALQDAARRAGPTLIEMDESVIMG
jgi:thiamine pyrophosphate-dependent acetolactate synthase large subunit-like protein